MIRKGSCGQGRVREWGAAECNYGNYCQSSPSSHPLTSNSHLNGTCPQHPEGTGRGQAAVRSGRQGPLEPGKHANPGALQSSLYAGEPRATGHRPPAPARAPGGPPTSLLVWTTPSPRRSALTQPSGSFAGVLSHCSGRHSHQAVLCQLPQESKCTAFPAKICLRHAVAKAHTFAVKRTGARCPIPSSAEERLQ